MVFFTCNNCGESVKKAAVEKHYQQRKCNGSSINVSCMDCLKDFLGNEYIAHTTCITEAEKYSGKNYVPKTKTNSNKNKQESWTEIVRSILDNEEYKLSNNARNSLKKLQQFDNVPRKKSKFQNFVTKCVRLSPNYANECWAVLEKELEKMKEAKQQQLQDEKLKRAENNEEVLKTPNVRQNAEENVPAKTSKKDKKSKTTNEIEDIKEVPVAQADVEDVSAKKSKKAKKSKQVNGTENEKDVSDVQQNDFNSVPAEKIKSVKKSKKEKVSKQVNGNEDEQVATDVQKNVLKRTAADENVLDVPAKKSRKEQQLKLTENGIKSPVKKSIKQNGIESDVLYTTNTDNCNETTTQAGDSEEFEWSETLQNIVKKAAKDGVSVEKLKRKILKKYMAKLSLETFNEKQQKKFEKKFSKNLKKCEILKLDGEIVKCF